MTTPELLYFAYGSNMDTKQLWERCPNSKIVGPAFVPDQKLTFPRRSKKRGCAVAGFTNAAGEKLWGVLFELTPDDLVKLDKSEGFDACRDPAKNSYNRKSMVAFAKDDAEHPISCFTYEAVLEPSCDEKPNRDYLDTILNGAREHGLPATCVSSLERIETAE